MSSSSPSRSGVHLQATGHILGMGWRIALFALILWCQAPAVLSGGESEGASEPKLNVGAAKELLQDGFALGFGRMAIQSAYTQDILDSAERVQHTQSQADSALVKMVSALLDRQRVLRDRIAKVNRGYNQLYPYAFGGFKKLAKRLQTLTYAGDKDLLQEAKRLMQEVSDLTSASRRLEDETYALLTSRGLVDAAALRYADVGTLPEKKPFPRLTITPEGAVDRIVFSGKGGVPLMGYDTLNPAWLRPKWTERDGEKDWLASPKNVEPILKTYDGWGYNACGIVSFVGMFYAPEWLAKLNEAGGDLTVYAGYRGEGSDPKKYLRWGDIHSTIQGLDRNHPLVQEMLMGYIDAIGSRFKGDPRISRYMTGWEYDDHDTAYTARGQAHFKDFLRTRYGTIDALNAAWKSDYASFDAIPTVRPTSEETRTVATPLLCEFERYRRDDLTAWIKRGYQRLKAADPTHCVVLDTSTWHGVFADHAGGVDVWENARAGSDVFSIHSGGSCEEAVVMYSINRTMHKPIYKHEYTSWNQPEGWRNDPDEAQEAAMIRNLWLNAGLGIRLFEFYGEEDTYARAPGDIGSRNNLLDLYSDYTIIRPLSGNVPLLKQKLNRHLPMFFGAQLVDPKIGVYYPETALRCAVPINSVKTACRKVNDTLLAIGSHFAYVFEPALAEGLDRLENYSVILLPYAIHLPKGMNERILNYIEKGGTVISMGPSGMYDELGLADGTILKTVFPGIQAAYAGNDGCAWNLTGPVETYRPAKDALLTAAFGKGRMFMTADGQDLGPEATGLLDAYAPPIVSWGADAQLRCILREGPTGRYLLAINLGSRPRDLVDDRLIVNGSYAVEDAFLPGMLVNVRQVNGMTVIPLYLQPGRVALFKLDGGPFQHPNAEQAKQALRLKLAAGVEALGAMNAELSRTGQEMLARLMTDLPSGDFGALSKRVNQDLVKLHGMAMKSRLGTLEAPSSDLTPAEQARRNLWIGYLNLVSDEASQTAQMNAVNEATEECEAYRTCLPAKPAAKHLLVEKTSAPIVVDGDLKEWAATEFHPLGERARFAMRHDADALYLAVQVEDALFVNAQSGNLLWKEDGLELFFDALNCKRGGMHFDDYHYVLGANGKSYLYNRRRTGEPAEVKTVAVKLPSGGYALEARIDLKGMQVPVVEGYLLGFELRIVYANGQGGSNAEKMKQWAGSGTPDKNTSDWGSIELR